MKPTEVLTYKAASLTEISDAATTIAATGTKQELLFALETVHRINRASSTLGAEITQLVESIGKVADLTSAEAFEAMRHTEDNSQEALVLARKLAEIGTQDHIEIMIPRFSIGTEGYNLLNQALKRLLETEATQETVHTDVDALVLAFQTNTAMRDAGN